MWYAALRTSLLEARDRRQELLDRLFPSADGSVIMLSLNLPGDQKSGERAGRLFAWGEQELAAALPASLVLRDCDALGPFALYRSHLEASRAKWLAIGVEASHPAGRLLDLDIFDGLGRSLDRAALGLPPRRCLLCPEPAVACIRTQRHTSQALSTQAHTVIDAL